MNKQNEHAARGHILEQAKSIINGARQDEYGTPENSFEAIAAFWSTYKGVEFSAHDVSMMMALLKIARIKSGSGKTDSYVDLCGYAALAADMVKREFLDKGIAEDKALYAAKK